MIVHEKTSWPQTRRMGKVCANLTQPFSPCSMVTLHALAADMCTRVHGTCFCCWLCSCRLVYDLATYIHMLSSSQFFQLTAPLRAGNASLAAMSGSPRTPIRDALAPNTPFRAAGPLPQSGGGGEPDSVKNRFPERPPQWYTIGPVAGTYVGLDYKKHPLRKAHMSRDGGTGPEAQKKGEAEWAAIGAVRKRGHVFFTRAC